jgi:hypothetical protein
MLRPIQTFEIQNKNTNEVLIRTSFCEIEAELDSAGALQIEKLKNELALKTMGSGATWLSQSLPEYRLFIPAPRPPQYFTKKQLSDFNSSQSNMEFEYVQSAKEMFGDYRPDMAKFDRIKSEAKIEGSEIFDPRTAESLFYEIVLTKKSSIGAQNSFLSQLNDLRVKDENQFFEYLIDVFTQTYWVTFNCRSALLPALKYTDTIGLDVERFIKEEDGHHLFLLQSLRALGVSEPPLDRVRKETKVLMDILRSAAEQSAFAFCCLVTVFEGSQYGEEDPLVNVIRQSSKPDAAAGIQKHYLVNKNGLHCQVGADMAAKLNPITERELCFAFNLLSMVESLTTNSLENLLSEGK